MALQRRVEQGTSSTCTGVNPAAQPFVVALLRSLLPDRPIVVVVDNLKSQEAFFQDLQTWSLIARNPDSSTTAAPQSKLQDQLDAQLLFYPAWEILPHEAQLPHADIIGERLETLLQLNTPHRPAPVVVTSAVALLQRTFPHRDLANRTRHLKQAAQCNPTDLAQWLESQGYEPEARVTQKGEFAMRGGILDVYPPTSPWPIRLEFFGNELESLRFFDPHSQASTEPLTHATLPPAGELGLLRQQLDLAQPRASLLDHLPDHAFFVFCEPHTLPIAAEQYLAHIPPSDPLVIPWADLIAALHARKFLQLDLTELTLPNTPVDQSTSASPSTAPIELSLPGLDAFRPVSDHVPDPQVAEIQRRDFFHQLHRWLRQDHAVHVICNNDGERQRFLEIWHDYGLDLPSQPPPTPQPTLHLGALTRGFLFPQARLAVVTDAEIFGRYKIQRPRRLKSPHAVATRSALEIDFADLETGDYVVHVQHGIGRYLGLSILPTPATQKAAPSPNANDSNPRQECLVVEFAPREPNQEPPKLYVPVTEAHLVSKYVGTGKAHPPLNTLGGSRWAKAKAHAEKAIRDFAGELLAIQATRESQVGHPLSPDSPWQREFESSFIYQETPDQLRAIQQTKSDLEAPRPMDRLICGDVGFGKTEIAIRAAFKAVIDGRQVAILVPTTVLAQQHFNTFRERMADYPVRIELLSRFRTRHQQQLVLRDLAAGSVDIVIGTHRLIQKDVAFKNLGLVIIDEEQRFGVAHKESFKQMRRLVHVLTLSATPIPRTLYLALTGARDMSTIETPPQDRLPVETIVAPYDERIIRDAIQRELNRGGQVFFLHNRVTTIHSVAQRLLTLVPHARLVIGHGQMHNDDLEEVMTRFVNGHADVLLSTTIIESGIDIPNANTIIIDRADRFGLSDLYQLRGRVGRYKHQAYAYFLLPRHASLLADARKRISAIKQYSTLGSGFKIAMRDLEIRGAGNLLGPEQSGHVTAVGFELYCQLLKQSIASLKGEKIPPRPNVITRLDFLSLTPGDSKPASTHRPAPAPAFLPLDYVNDPQQRIEFYRKLAQTSDSTALQLLQEEIRDRFGPPPPAVILLFQVAKLKILATLRNVSSIETRDDRIMLVRHGDYLTRNGKFPRLTKRDARGRLLEIQRLLLSL
jgi:transcription-repair coupling factor (superfamily II helicase)